MLTVGKIAATPTAGRYCLEQVSRGVEDYYAGGGEAPGGWLGAGAAALGLGGEVAEEGILRLLSARDPKSGDLLRRPLTSGAVAGFDLTFRAPKSVSVLFAIADDPVVQQVRAAHRAAVSEALGYLEREACRTRRGHGGLIVVEGRGFVAAAFEHRSSRAGDPLLHTHVVVANATQGPDGRWTALDGRLLYRHSKTAGYLYQAVLRAELTERLRVRWLEVERGTADLAGVPRGVIEHFSRRRAEIVEHMTARGERSARAAQIATLQTRRRKDYAVPRDRLREDWRARSAEHGFSRFRVRAIVGRTRPRTRAADAGALERTAATLEGPDGLTRESSTFTRRDVLQALAQASGAGARVRDIEAQADGFLDRDEIVALDPVSGERRYSTRKQLRTERELLDGALRRRDDGVGLCGEAELDAALDERPTLTEEQRRLVAGLARSGDGVQVVRAAAGTGKTFALDAARQAWQRSGVPVLGCALSARAAGELRDQAGVDATTIARLRHALERRIELMPGSVLIVDEAGMVGTRNLAALADAASRAEAKLVLIDDDRQLPEIDAGGAFRALARRLGVVELREVHRQREPWDRDALAELRDGNVERFAQAYHDHGRLTAETSAEAARGALARDWWHAHEGGERVLMIAHRRSDVADLNHRARSLLRAAGRIGADAVRTHDRCFAIGDRVVTTRNEPRLQVVNGQAGTLTAVSDGQLRVELDEGRNVELPRSYAFEGHLDHAYAITAHRAQGATVDRAFVLGSEELYREWGYTALSRSPRGGALLRHRRPGLPQPGRRAAASRRHAAPRRPDARRQPHPGPRPGRDRPRPPRRTGAPVRPRPALSARRGASSRAVARPRPFPRRRHGSGTVSVQPSFDEAEGRRGLTRAELMTARVVADLISVPISTVREWGRNGTLPRVKLGRHVRYIRTHVEATILEAEERLSRPAAAGRFHPPPSPLIGRSGRSLVLHPWSCTYWIETAGTVRLSKKGPLCGPFVE